MVSESYQVLDEGVGFRVKVGNLSRDQEELNLTIQDLVKLRKGETLLRAGILVRQDGEGLEFRIVRPGVQSERRMLGLIPFVAFESNTTTNQARK